VLINNLRNETVLDRKMLLNERWLHRYSKYLKLSYMEAISLLSLEKNNMRVVFLFMTKSKTNENFTWKLEAYEE
jgi:hypothetical protein